MLRKTLTHKHLSAASDKEREKMCEEITNYITSIIENSLLDGPEDSMRDQVIFEVINELRFLDHELKNWDWDEDLEVWGHDYKKSGSFGLVVAISFSDGIEAYWHDPEKRARGS